MKKRVPPDDDYRARGIPEGSSSATTNESFRKSMEAAEQRTRQRYLEMAEGFGWRGSGVPTAGGSGGGSMRDETERGTIPNLGGRVGLGPGTAARTGLAQSSAATLGDRECIVLDGDSEEEEVQFLGEGQALPFQPRRVEAWPFQSRHLVQPAPLPPFPTTPRPNTSSYSFQPYTPAPPRPSSSQLQTPTPPHPSSQKRKLNSLDAVITPTRPPPHQRQARSAQSLSRSEWTFGGECISRLSAGSEAAVADSVAVEEAVSPFSAPTNSSKRDRSDSMSGSINRKEGYQLVDMPEGDGVVNGGPEVPARPGKRTEIGKYRLAAAAEKAAAEKEKLATTPAKNKEVNNLLLRSHGFTSLRDLLASETKGTSGGNLESANEVVGAVGEQLTPTTKGKNVGNLGGGNEDDGAVKDQLSPTNKGKNVSFHIKGDVVTTTKDQLTPTRKSKNSDVDQDWEVIEVGASTNLARPVRFSTPPKPVIDLEDYEFLPTLSNTPSTPTKPTIIDSSDSEGEFEFEIISSHTLTPTPRRRSTIYPLRNPPIAHPFYSITATIISALSLTPSTVVELSDGDFLQITDLIRNVDTGAVTLRGHRFQRTRDLNGLLAKKRNELCWVTEVDEDDERPAAVQSLSEVPGSSVTRVRKAFITNMAFPAATFRNIPHTGTDLTTVENVENEGVVSVRWKYTTTWPSAKERVNNENAFCERVLRHLAEGDALVGEGLRLCDELARDQFRGPTVKGGSFVPSVGKGWLRQRMAGQPRSEKLQKMFSLTEMFDEDDMVDLTDEMQKRKDTRLSVAKATQERKLSQIDLTTPELSLPPSDGTVRATNAASKKPAIKRVEGQMYTYGDAFCGAGGATRGAHTAGLKVLWGFDFNDHACETWRLNFPTATMYEMSAFDVCNQWAKEAKSGLPNRAQVDILHISPPCQFFSPAHTIAGKDDEMNTASLLACGRLLALVKPRVVTLEQTFGIGHAEFTRWFNALIHQFTDNGYSLRWKICHLQDWGLPQRRQRLIIIAACHGETLPPFPPYTHSRHPTHTGLKPYTSVNNLLTSIPAAAPDHDLATALSKPLHETPWDGTSIAPRAITTHGGQNYHPSGTRGFTNRELATLQGFPLGHRFGERNVKKQIGNAVPPSVGAVLFGAVKKGLEDGDGVERVVVVVD